MSSLWEAKTSEFDLPDLKHGCGILWINIHPWVGISKVNITSVVVSQILKASAMTLETSITIICSPRNRKPKPRQKQRCGRSVFQTSGSLSPRNYGANRDSAPSSIFSSSKISRRYCRFNAGQIFHVWGHEIPCLILHPEFPQHDEIQHVPATLLNFEHVIDLHDFGVTGCHWLFRFCFLYIPSFLKSTYRCGVTHFSSMETEFHEVSPETQMTCVLYCFES